jgi:YggT family protein
VVLLANSVMLIAGWPAEAIILGALYRFLNWIIYGFIALLIIEVVFSWINPHAPLAPFIHALNDPLLRPLRRVIPPIGGIDLTVLVALILLQVLQSVLGRIFF